MIIEGIKAQLETKYFSGKAKERNISALIDLKDQKGWVILADFLGMSADKLAEQILDVGRVHDKDLDDKDREVLGLFKWVKELPDKLLDMFNPIETHNNIPDNDPYEKVVKKDL